MLQPSDLKKYRYFSSLSKLSLEFLATRLTVIICPKGSVILKKDEPGRSFYFVKSGRLEVAKRTEDGAAARVSVIGSDHSFGEMALLSCGSRSSSITAETDVTLYRLPKSDFENIILQESAVKGMLENKVDNYDQYKWIRLLEPFTQLEPDRMYSLIHQMTERTYEPGEDIIVQGEKCDVYHIIKTGKVAAFKQTRDKPEVRLVALFLAGQAFGVEAFINDYPRNATCRAVERTTVLALNKSDFNRILDPSFLEFIMSEEIDLRACRERYTIIDTRTAPEYEEEHIDGSVHIPLETLENSLAGFEPSGEYITYSTNDSRGMVAAFLLKNRGFEAKCLCGGITAWNGPVATNHNGVHMPDESGQRQANAF